MRSVGLKVLNNKLSEYERLAAAGETVLVTDRDRGRRRDRAAARRAESHSRRRHVRGHGAQGPADAPDRARQGTPPAPKPIMKLEELLAELHQDQSDRFETTG